MAPPRTPQTGKCNLSVQRNKSKAIFSSVNSYRRSKNVPPLTWDDQLFTYCVLHNIDMHGSRIKPSHFDIGQPYNENTCCFVKSGQVLDIWRSHDQEKQNLLFKDVKYSAIALCGDDHECYATQIFTAHKPRGDAPSMKTHKPCNTCRVRKSASRAKSSAGTNHAKSIASKGISSSKHKHPWRTRSKSRAAIKRSASVPNTWSSSAVRTGMTRRVSNLARTGVTQKVSWTPRSVLPRRVSSTPRTGETRRVCSTPRSGVTGKSSSLRVTSSNRPSAMKGIGQSIRSRLKYFGGAPTRGSTQLCPQFRTQHRLGGRDIRRPPDSFCTCDAPSSIRFSGESSRRPEFPRMPCGRFPSFSSDDSFHCSICNSRRCSDFCDTCSRNKC